MKTARTILSISTTAIIAAALLVGCSLFGSNPSAPSSVEQHAFDIATNVVPQIVTRTNVVTTTNVVNAPSPAGGTVLQTNVVNETHVVTVTNQVEQYQFSPKPAAVATAQALGTASGPFTAGIGTMVSSGLIMLYGLWAHLRSNKEGNTSTALAQEIETIREFILTLPSGTKIDQAVTQFMQQHQVEAGVAQNVLGILAKNVSNNDAVAAAKTLSDAIGIMSATPKA